MPDALGKQVTSLMKQMRGIGAGYRATAIGMSKPLTDFDIFMMNFQHEVEDVEAAVGTRTIGSRKLRDMECTGLVKVTSDDLYVAHTTWTRYKTMLRMYKTYKFETAVTMSGYGGLIESKDDWYITSSGLAIFETTNPADNVTLFQLYVLPHTISEFLRVTAASYLATTSQEWVRLYEVLNSGTYNNQWVVVNMRLFVPGKPIVRGTMWVSEQMPGIVVSADQSDLLNKMQYFPSYNIPFYPLVRKISLNDDMERQYGSFFSYDDYCRARILRREHANITNIEGMKKVMRFNKYQTDPYSLIPNCSGTPDGKCNPPRNPSLSLASRYDLSGSGGPTQLGPLWRYFNPACFGGTDAKISSWSRMRGGKLTGVVVAGPTNDDQPAFRWSTSSACATTRPQIHGLVDLYNFSWQEYTVLV